MKEVEVEIEGVVLISIKSDIVKHVLKTIKKNHIFFLVNNKKNISH